MLIKGGSIIGLDGPEPADLLIEGDRIVEVGALAVAPELPEGSVAAVSDGLLMPGLLNGHAHSSMTVLRGSAE